MNKIQSRAVKVLGADITDAGLQQTLYNLGIDESVKSMTQAEKTIVRYIALQEQLKNAEGDTSRTINSVSNQVKIFKEQLAIAGRQIGAVFIPILQTILPILNGILMAFNAIIAAILGLFGIDAESLADGFGVAATEIGGIGESLDNVSNAAEKAKRGLRGFDKLNNITTPDSSGSGISGIGGGGISKDLLAAINEYDMKLEEIRSKAFKIRNAILEWLGFTIDENGEITGFHVTLGTILATLGLIAIAWRTISKLIGGITIGKGLLSLLGGTAIKTGAMTTVSWLKGEIIGLTTALTISSPALAAFLKGLQLFSVGLGKGALAAQATYYALEGLTILTKEGIEKIADVDFDNYGDKLRGVSDTTQKQLKNVQDSFDNTANIINNSLVLKEDTKKNLIKSVEDLTATLDEKVKEYVETQKANALDLYNNGFITEEQYNEKIKELDNYQKTELENNKNHKDKLIELQKNMYDENGNIILEKYKEYIDYLNTYENESLTKLALSEEDKKKIEDNARKYSKSEKAKYYSELMTQYAKDRDEAIKAAEEKYKTVTEEAAKLYGKESETYKNIEKEAKKSRDKTVTSAKNSYDDIYDSLVTTESNMSSFISKDDGHLVSSTEFIMNEFKSTWKTAWENIENDAKTIGSGIATWWNNLSFNKKKLSVEADTDKTVTVKAKEKAEGGFVNEGELFVAREAGPEMVGTINGKSAVANNDQIVEAISVGVAKAMMATGNKPVNVNITASGDASGLLNFINFEQQKKNRQYGM